MSAIRCKACHFVAATNQGFCPECGAMYIEPFDYVDANAAITNAAPKVEKKKKGGLLASLFGGGRRQEPTLEPGIQSQPASSPSLTSALPPDLPQDQLKIRCQECRHIVLMGEQDGFCPDCGAFFVEPYEYVTEEMLAQEKAAAQAEIDNYRPVEKPFEEMNDHEKLVFLKEKLADAWDQIIKDRHVLNEKANECMQCFTAAGTIKSEDQYEVLASTIKQRYHNLQDFELVYADYKRLLAAFSKSHETLLQVRAEYLAHEARMKQQSNSS